MKEVIRAEMVANVLEVTVSLGESVSIGETLLLLESMKMEIPVLSEFEGLVVDVGVAAGDVIQEGDPLITIETPGKLERKIE
ncbi:MAG: biotin/lipoyl-binding carrier protein [Actinobacteria bacterium]|uniref:Biotin/lipoyl-binding carrier protein n=1 Tax=Candidatus Fonsibacter lacus TaxID=2576439 RepID=A0A965LK65_9PROT|nr:biotin/lipoyl-binding carrier protein [Candidatus Fonsibacter lacus]